MNRVLRIVLPLVVVAGGGAVAAGLVFSAKKPTKKAVAPLPPKVEFTTLSSQQAPAAVQALGTVVPARTLALQAEVSGRVLYVHPDLVPGGTIAKGQTLVRIDCRQIKYGLDERKAAEARARFDLSLEKGRGRVAAREWDLVGSAKKSGPEGKALALRQPHLQNAKAALAGAEAAVARSELDASRCSIRAPFDVMVREESLEVGQIVSPQSRLATLVGTEAFWVETSVPVSALRWIRTEADGPASAAVASQAMGDAGEAQWQGSVLRVMGEVDPKGRMARVMVTIKDPLALSQKDRPTLLLGAYVNIAIQGKALEDVFVVPRPALRQDNLLWVVDGSDKLRIRKTQPVWRSGSQIYIREAVQAGDRVITSRLRAPVEGMQLRTASSEAAQ